MVRLSVHLLAVKEYDAAFAWYARRSVNVAARFRDEVNAAIGRISASPSSGPALTSKDRFVRVRRYPYILIYRIFPDQSMAVLAVAHTARRPGYWKRRS